MCIRDRLLVLVLFMPERNGVRRWIYLGPVSYTHLATAGGCLGFLIWNFNPAKVFMGDTGSLFLGGMVCALGYGLNLPVLILPVGIIYIVEILSVVLQVTYFKAVSYTHLQTDFG